MPSLATESLDILRSALIVAALAVPAGLACAALARKAGEPLLPFGRKWTTRWFGADVFVLAFACLVLRGAIAMTLWSPPAADLPKPDQFRIQHERSTFVGLLLMPIAAYGFFNWKRLSAAEATQGATRPGPRLIADAAVGTIGWLVLAPAVFAVHFLTNLAMDALRLNPDDHPLKQLRIDSTRDAAILFAGACVVAPFFEELGCRRLMIPWAARRLARSGIVFAIAGAVAVISATGGSRWGPLLFVLVVAGLVGVVLVQKKFLLWPLRSTAAIASSAALFAVIHSGVWPTPIPLFILGLGLGWLVHRTRGATAAIVAHGLFNAISVTMMLRGATG